MLRRIELDELDIIFEERNRKNMFKWCRQFLPLHYADHLCWYEKQRKDPSIEMFAIIGLSDSDIVGVCGLTSIDYVNRTAEFSCYIFSDSQRRGYAFNALKDLFEIGFNNLNLNLIWGETFENNPAIALFEKIGMKRDGVRRQFYFRDGKYIDAHLISITREEWNSTS